MVVVSLLNGTVMFLADLIRNLSLPLRLDFIGVSSYGAGTESGDLVFTKELRLDVRGRDVLLVDDILDTGKTLYRVRGKLRALKPRRIKTCVLLNKAARRVEPVEADYVGFEIPDFFVVGYGLDFAERYRNLPFVGVLHPHVYKKASRQINVARPRKPGGRQEAKLPIRSQITLRHACNGLLLFLFQRPDRLRQVTETLPDGSTLDDLFKQLAVRFPKLAAMRKSTLMAVGVDYQDRSYVLKAGDEVSLFPPVQGG